MHLNRIQAGILRRYKYHLVDRFDIDKANPLGTPLSASPGPGIWTVADTTNIMSIVNGRLVVNGLSAIGTGIGYAPGFTRIPGRALLLQVPTHPTWAVNYRVGWGTVAALTDNAIQTGVIFNSATTILGKDQTSNITNLQALGTGAISMAFILRNNGGYILTRDITANPNGPWTLNWVGNAGTHSPVYPKMVAAGTLTDNFTIDNIRVVDLPAPFNTEYGPAVARIAGTITAGSQITSNKDGMVECTFVHSAANDTALRFRYVDANNHWRVQAQASTGNLQLVEVNAGVATVRAQVTTMFSAGNTYRMVAVFYGNVYAIYRMLGNAISSAAYTDAGSFNINATTVEMNSIGTSTSEVIAWPRTIALPNV